MLQAPVPPAHRSHVPAQLVWQQTPSAQKPVMHCPPVLQASPVFCKTTSMVVLSERPPAEAEMVNVPTTFGVNVKLAPLPVTV